MEVTMNKSYEPGRINPQKFGLWISMGSLLMMFGAFTSAYIVRHAAGNWLEFNIPNQFLFSTALIIISSISLQASYYFFTKNKALPYKLLLSLTFVLGLAFLAIQWQGWNQLYEWGVGFNINPSASFFYLIGWVHAAHIIGGLTTLIVAQIHAYTLDNNFNELRRHRFQLVLQFWHFLGILWIYLYVFLTIMR